MFGGHDARGSPRSGPYCPGAIIKPTINIDPTNDTASIMVQPAATGGTVQVVGLKLGETAGMTMNRVDVLARQRAKALQAAIAQL